MPPVSFLSIIPGFYGIHRIIECRWSHPDRARASSVHRDRAATGRSIRNLDGAPQRPGRVHGRFVRVSRRPRRRWRPSSRWGGACLVQPSGTERCGRSRLSNGGGARVAGRGERSDHRRRSSAIRALGDAGDRDSPLRHALLPGAHARRARSRNTTKARRPRSNGCRHSEAIARFNRKELLLPPPTYTSIRQLAPRTSIDDVFAWAKPRRSRG